MKRIIVKQIKLIYPLLYNEGINQSTIKEFQNEIDYSALFIWPKAKIPAKNIDLFPEFFRKHFNTRVKFIENIPTESTENRIDILFAVHRKDVKAFINQKHLLDIQWLSSMIVTFKIKYQTEIINKYFNRI